MSISSTISGASHMPSGSFGNSRRPPRAHMRSGNWSHIPSSTMAPTVEDEDQHTEVVIDSHSNDHEHHHNDLEHSHAHSHTPNFVTGHNHTHSHSHSQSHSHGHGHSHSHSDSHSVVDVKSTTHIDGSGESLLVGVKTSDAYSGPFQMSDNVPFRLVEHSTYRQW